MVLNAFDDVASTIHQSLHAGEDNTCVAGGRCYRAAWIANGVAVCVAVACASWLAQRRSRRAPPNALSRIS